MNLLGNIWQQHSGAVRQFALHLTGDRSDADDLTSEAFVRLMTTSSPIRTETVRGYLFVIVRNLHRRRHRDPGRFVELIEQATDAEGPDAQVAHRQQAQRVRQALARLPDVDRAALLMRMDGELSYEDIGAALNIASGAARVRVHRARRKLLEQLQAEEHGVSRA